MTDFHDLAQNLFKTLKSHRTLLMVPRGDRRVYEEVLHFTSQIPEFRPPDETYAGVVFKGPAGELRLEFQFWEVTIQAQVPHPDKGNHPMLLLTDAKVALRRAPAIVATATSIEVYGRPNPGLWDAPFRPLQYGSMTWPAEMAEEAMEEL